MNLRARHALFAACTLVVFSFWGGYLATTAKSKVVTPPQPFSKTPMPTFSHKRHNITGSQFQPSDVVIAVITSNKNAAKIRAIAATWAFRHSGVNILYFNARDAIKDPSLADPGNIAEHPYNKSMTLEYPASQVIALDIEEENTHRVNAKTIFAFAYMWEHYTDCKWFMKADDDTYVVIDNYLQMLSNYDSNIPTALGYIIPGDQFSGGAGYTLSWSALERVVERLPDCNERMENFPEKLGEDLPEKPGEDTVISQCLHEVGVNLTHVPGHFFDPPHKFYNSWVKPYWATLAEFPLTFHYVDPHHMFEIDYLLHYAKVAKWNSSAV